MSVNTPAVRAAARIVWLAGGVGVLLVLAAIAIAQTQSGSRWNGDVPLYDSYAGALLARTLGRTDFLSVYPPLALAPITLPRLISGDPPVYAFLFAVEMAVTAAALIPVASSTAARWPQLAGSGGAVFWLAVAMVLAAGILPWRFDPVPALATAIALWAVAAGSPALAGGLLGFGTALKLYPAILLPVVLAWYAVGRDWRKATGALIGFTMVVALGFGLYLLFPGSDLLHLLRMQGGRGLQVESVPASVIGVAVVAGGIPAPSVVFETRSYNLVGPGADAALAILSIAGPLLIAATFGAIAWSFGRQAKAGNWNPTALVMALTATLLALVLARQVFSPQYLFWMLPFVPLLHGAYRPTFAIILALTGAIFPFLYDGLLRFDAVPVLMLAARNGLVVSLFVAVMVWLIRNPARSA